jgi:hypothetical protein
MAQRISRSSARCKGAAWTSPATSPSCCACSTSSTRPATRPGRPGRRGDPARPPAHPRPRGAGGARAARAVAPQPRPPSGATRLSRSHRHARPPGPRCGTPSSVAASASSAAATQSSEGRSRGRRSSRIRPRSYGGGGRFADRHSERRAGPVADSVPIAARVCVVGHPTSGGRPVPLGGLGQRQPLRQRQLGADELSRGITTPATTRTVDSPPSPCAATDRPAQDSPDIDFELGSSRGPRRALPTPSSAAWPAPSRSAVCASRASLRSR